MSRKLNIKPKLPLLFMVAVILSGLVISILAVYFVSRQKQARELEFQNDLFKRVEAVGNQLETRSFAAIEAVFQDMSRIPVDFGDPSLLLKLVEGVASRHPVVQYPFIITGGNRYLFPAQPAVFLVPGLAPGPARSNADLRQVLLPGEILEYREKNYPSAIKSYLGILGTRGRGEEGNLGVHVLAGVARCYYKMQWYPQALHYYRRILASHREKVEGNRVLFLTVLRQSARCYDGLGRVEAAVAAYRVLYEKLLDFEKERILSRDVITIFLGETLEYLGRHSNEEVGKPGGANWYFLDLDQLGAAGGIKDELGLLKSADLLVPRDEKTRFYQDLKDFGLWGHISLPGLVVTEVPPFIVAGKKVKSGNPVSVDIYFGFSLSMDFMRDDIFSPIEKGNLEGLRLQCFLNENGERGTRSAARFRLLSVPLERIFQGKSLELYADRESFIENYAQRAMWLNYGLILAMFLALSGGIYLYYRYMSREAELIRLKAKFLDGVSHTLKTPLTRISLLSENVQQGWVDGESAKEEFLQAVISETARMNEMIDNMLNFSRLEAGKLRYEPFEVSLPALVQSILGRYSGYLESLGFRVDVEIDESLPLLSLDREAVDLAVVNLLQNAVKYSLKDKYILVKVFREGSRVVLEVADHGMGIDKKDRSRIFERFYRGRGDRVRALEGSGLGLFLVYHVVTAHGGDVKVDSEPGEGSVFTLSFPIENVEDS